MLGRFHGPDGMYLARNGEEIEELTCSRSPGGGGGRFPRLITTRDAGSTCSRLSSGPLPRCLTFDTDYSTREKERSRRMGHWMVVRTYDDFDKYSSTVEVTHPGGTRTTAVPACMVEEETILKRGKVYSKHPGLISGSLSPRFICKSSTKPLS